MNKNRILNTIGLVFLIWGTAAIIDNILHIDEGIAPILWISYISLIILAIGLFKKNSGLIASQIAIIGIPYLIWNSDFFYHLFTSKSLFGITDYFFELNNLVAIEKIISFQHIFNIPLSLWALHLIGLKKNNFWIVSIVQIAFVFIITRTVTNYEENVNCVYRNCAGFTFGIPYIIEWFTAYILMISITSWFLVKIFKKREK
ncbi:MAG: hypothetical protein AABW89_02795 [Nanoarchaeota archaeon]